MSNASAQVRVDLTAIKDSVACFGSGRQAEYCAVLEVAGSQQSLATVDEARQEELLAGYAQFLNSLTFVFQLVVQVHPVTSPGTWRVSKSVRASYHHRWLPSLEITPRLSRVWPANALCSSAEPMSWCHG